MKKMMLALLGVAAFSLSAQTPTTTRVSEGSTPILGPSGDALSNGTWCFNGTCTPIDSGFFGGPFTPGTGTVTVNGRTGSLLLTVPNVTISGATYSWGSFVLGASATASGSGAPTLKCAAGAQYTQTSQSNLLWTCSGTPGVWTASALNTSAVAGNVLRYKGAWQANTVYSGNPAPVGSTVTAYSDVVLNGGTLYVANSTFLTGATFSATNFTPLGSSSGGGATIPATTSVLKGDNAGNAVAATNCTDYITAACNTAYTGNNSYSGTTTRTGADVFSSGWVGTIGNATFAPAPGSGSYFTDAVTGDLIFRSTTGGILFGNSSGQSALSIRGDSSIFKVAPTISTFTTAGLVKNSAAGLLGMATPGTDYALPYTFATGLLKTGNSVAIDPSVVTTNSNLQQAAGILGTSASGSATTYTLALSPVPQSLSALKYFIWIPDVNGSGGATTLNVNALGAVPVKKLDGATNPSATDIVANQPLVIYYDGTSYRITNNAIPTGVLSESNGGSGANLSTVAQYAMIAQGASNVLTGSTNLYSDSLGNFHINNASTKTQMCLENTSTGGKSLCLTTTGNTSSFPGYFLFQDVTDAVNMASFGAQTGYFSVAKNGAYCFSNTNNAVSPSVTNQQCLIPSTAALWEAVDGSGNITGFLGNSFRFVPSSASVTAARGLMNYVNSATGTQDILQIYKQDAGGSTASYSPNLLQSSMRIVTAATTTTQADYAVIAGSATTAAFTITLMASPAQGTSYVLSNESGFAVTLAVPSGVTLAGTSNGTLTLAAASASAPTRMRLQFDTATGWHIV